VSSTGKLSGWLSKCTLQYRVSRPWYFHRYPLCRTNNSPASQQTSSLGLSTQGKKRSKAKLLVGYLGVVAERGTTIISRLSSGRSHLAPGCVHGCTFYSLVGDMGIKLGAAALCQ
jgi:hypothetical protein